MMILAALLLSSPPPHLAPPTHGPQQTHQQKNSYGLAIGYYCAWLVRGLMALTFPVSYPISRLLDAMLGAGRPALLRRTQLKALVDLHGADEGLGGNLTEDEVQVICGALDLTAKTARRSMTPLDKVFMLPSDAVLDSTTLLSVMDSERSRIPVYERGDR